MRKTTIGRWVYIDLPDLDITNVKAKVDTGAYRCSLHCDFIKRAKLEGHTYLTIVTTDLTGKPLADHASVVRQLGVAKVKSSNGQRQERPIVQLPVVIDGERYLTEFTLTNRQDMKFPILLGRKFLKGNFIVDVALDAPEEE